MSVSDEELKKAVALCYDGDKAPKVGASGTGIEAEEIIALAQEHGVPLCDNPGLLEFLLTLEVGDEIPESLYIAIAHILSFAYQLTGKTPED
ncbi:MAG: EscU/YscU/HrcU family type III secretion system export apparatus switch protein [Cellvibrionaceae bacterium]